MSAVDRVAIAAITRRNAELEAENSLLRAAIANHQKAKGRYHTEIATLKLYDTLK